MTLNKKYQFSNHSYKDFINKIDQFYINSSNILASGRNEIKLVKYDNKNFAVKSFQTPIFVRSFLYNSIFKSKAEKAFNNSKLLIENNISTPEPIGFMCLSRNYRLTESFYICSYINFDFDLRKFFEDFNKNIHIIEDFISFVFDMHEKNLYHHDLTRGNILISIKNNNINFNVVDTNRISYGKMSLKMRMESLSKISNNLEQLNFIAKYYSVISDYKFEDCKKYIIKGFRKSQKYKKAKKLLRGK